MDHKKTYYNSILSQVPAKFKYLRRSKHKHQLDEDGNSMRDDLDDIGMTSFSDSRMKFGPVKTKNARYKRGKSGSDFNGDNLDQKQKIKGLIDQYFSMQDKDGKGSRSGNDSGSVGRFDGAGSHDFYSRF